MVKSCSKWLNDDFANKAVKTLIRLELSRPLQLLVIRSDKFDCDLSQLAVLVIVLHVHLGVED